MLIARVAVPARSANPVPTPTGACEGPAAAFHPVSGSPQWNGWGASPLQQRFVPATTAGIAPSAVSRLKVRWAFGFEGATHAYGQPTIFGGRVFVGSENHHVYALNARTGCVAWNIDVGAPVRTALVIGKSGDRFAAYFADQRANVFAVDAATGAIRWSVRADDHPAALVTGAPTLAGGTLFVPVSSREEVLAANPAYPCCTFRGSLVALDPATGRRIWKTYTIAQAPSRTGTTTRGTERLAPSGAAVWSSPAVDVKRHIVYMTTGDSYSDPAAPTSDAVIALDARSGNVLWSQQIRSNDSYNVACALPAPSNANCPAADGPDFDFGASPAIVTLASGRSAIIVGQKSGVMTALDPDRRGAKLWQTRVGIGSKLGGVQWGFAIEANLVFVAVSDVKFSAVAAGTAGSQPSALGVSFAFDPASGGGLYALDAATGAVRWKAPPPKCDGRSGCSPAQSAAVSAIPGIVFSGGLDGHMRAYARSDGAVVGDWDTEHAYETTNGVQAHGGSIDGPGATAAGGMLYVESGYGSFADMPGNVLLAFSVDGA